MKHKTSHSHRSLQAGFNLLEIAIVVAIIATVIGTSMAGFVAYTKKEGLEATKHRLAELEVAIVNYRQLHGRLPCPGDIQLEASDVSFGAEGGEAGACAGTNNYTSGEVVAGMLPVRAMGLADEMAFDSWGSRIYYVVDRRFTNFGGMKQYSPRIAGSIEVGLGALPSAATVVADAALVIMSFGPNRHGGFSRKGSATRNSSRTGGDITSDVFASWEVENCDCDGLTGANGTFDNEFVQALFSLDPSDTEGDDEFDDLLIYVTRPQLQ